MKKNILFLFLLLMSSVPSWGQKQDHAVVHGKKGHRFNHFRIALLLGHTLIPEKAAGENFLIPSWGLDLEYWFGRKFGLGLHNDIEIETFVLEKGDYKIEALERVYPLVSTLDALYRPWNGLVLQTGLGIELERKESFFLYRAGLEYEFEINHKWDFGPSAYYDYRFDNYHTWSFALGVAKHF